MKKMRKMRRNIISRSEETWTLDSDPQYIKYCPVLKEMRQDVVKEQLKKGKQVKPSLFLEAVSIILSNSIYGIH
jgi:hypothetical protein